MIDFTGQVAVATGAGRGLGRVYALDLARRGHRWSSTTSAAPCTAPVRTPRLPTRWLTRSQQTVARPSPRTILWTIPRRYQRPLIAARGR